MNGKLEPNGKAICIDSAYHGYGPKVVLGNVDLQVKSGEFLCLVGPSGCGKSTLLRLITGQERIQKARRFDVLGQKVGLPDYRRGVVFQNYSLVPHLTVLENVLLGLKYQASFRNLISPKWRSEAKKKVLEYLEKVRLSDAADRYPNELSGGMRQRVSIAQTLITIDLFGMPKILCMDEPYGALDPATREEMQIFILELWEKYGITVVFVTHDIEEAVFLGTRVIILSQYWRSDLPLEKQAGSRIVHDIPLPRHALSTKVKLTTEFAMTVAEIRETGFSGTKRRHVNEFNLNHPDSFQTLEMGENMEVKKIA